LPCGRLDRSSATSGVPIDISGQTIVITGGAGFIGSHLADRLADHGVGKIVIVDNFFLGNEANLSSVADRIPIRIVRADAADLAVLQTIGQQENPIALVAMATVPLPTSLEYPTFATKTNVDLAIAACEATRRGYTGKLIQFSSSEVYGSAKTVPMTERHEREPHTPYAAAKAAADDITMSYVRTFDIDAAVMRPFNTYGPRQNRGAYAGVIPTVIERVKDDEIIQIHGDGLQTRDFVNVAETAESVVRSLKADLPQGSVVNVSTGVETSVLDLVQMILSGMGVPDYPVEHVESRIGDVRRHAGDSTLLYELTHYRPAAIGKDNLQPTIEWFANR
jgi:UDP-glucose 4-epimerase